MIPEIHLEPDPENPICDFCSAPDPQWEFNIEPGHEIGEDEGLHSMDEDGRWAACDPCKEFIVERQNAFLAERSVVGFFRKYRIPDTKENRNMVLARVRQAHNFFFTLWDGKDPKPVQP